MICRTGHFETTVGVSIYDKSAHDIHENSDVFEAKSLADGHFDKDKPPRCQRRKANIFGLNTRPPTSSLRYLLSSVHAALTDWYYMYEIPSFVDAGNKDPPTSGYPRSPRQFSRLQNYRSFFTHACVRLGFSGLWSVQNKNNSMFELNRSQHQAEEGRDLVVFIPLCPEDSV